MCRSWSCWIYTPSQLPDDITTTVYYVASEAITNAVKYAAADRIDVHVARYDGRVEVRVTDNGKGGATMTPGSGLAGLGDRVSALWGSGARRWMTGHRVLLGQAPPCPSQ
jgi:signal transduction histidine kinase